MMTARERLHRDLESIEVTDGGVQISMPEERFIRLLREHANEAIDRAADGVVSGIEGIVPDRHPMLRMIEAWIRSLKEPSP